MPAFPFTWMMSLDTAAALTVSLEADNFHTEGRESAHDLHIENSVCFIFVNYLPYYAM